MSFQCLSCIPLEAVVAYFISHQTFSYLTHFCCWCTWNTFHSTLISPLILPNSGSSKTRQEKAKWCWKGVCTPFRFLVFSTQEVTTSVLISLSLPIPTHTWTNKTSLKAMPLWSRLLLLLYPESSPWFLFHSLYSGIYCSRKRLVLCVFVVSFLFLKMFEVDRDHWQSYWSEQGLPEAVNKTRTSDRKEKRKKPGKTKRAIQEQYKSRTNDPSSFPRRSRICSFLPFTSFKESFWWVWVKAWEEKYPSSHQPLVLGWKERIKVWDESEENSPETGT